MSLMAAASCVQPVPARRPLASVSAPPSDTPIRCALSLSPRGSNSEAPCHESLTPVQEWRDAPANHQLAEQVGAGIYGLVSMRPSEPAQLVESHQHHYLS